MAAQAPTITIKKEDRIRAARINRSAILSRVERMSDGQFSKFVERNLGLFRSLLEEERGLSAEESLRRARKNIQRMPLSIAERIDMASLKIERVKPETFAQQRLEREIRSAQFNERAYQGIASAAYNAKSSTHYLGKIMGGVSSIATIPFYAAAFAGKWGVSIPANLLYAGFNAARVPTSVRASFFGAALLGLGYVATEQVDAIPYHPEMGVQNVFKAACTPYVLKSSASNAAYTLNFNSTAAGSIEKHTHDTMMMANRHGAPAMALHLISYLESMKFTDMQANNSTASNPFQVIDSTKMLYIKSYGQDTFLYQDAQSRINAGLASTMDIALVGAIDAVSTIPMEQLNKMIADQKYPGYVHDAKTLADVSAMSAELVVLDMLKSVPEIANPDLTPEQIVDIAARYYTKEHFLGVGNYNMFQTVAAKQPNLSITDVKGMTAAFGAKTAENFLGIVKRNPGLLEDGMTAAQALQNITDKFKSFVDPELRKFSTVYTAGLTTYEQCLSDKAIAMNLPRTIPRWQAISYSWGHVWKIGVAPYFDAATAEKKKSNKEKEKTAAKQTGPQPEPA